MAAVPDASAVTAAVAQGEAAATQGETEAPDAKRARSRATVLILDGSCGLELKKRKALGRQVAYNLQLFSSAALIETPEAIRELHADYLAAGAQVLTTATYAVTKFYLNKANQEHRLVELARLAVRLAKGAVDAAHASQPGKQRPALVAGSVPPLSESYRADLILEPQTLHSEYIELTAAMAAEPGVDVWLCETMSSCHEAKAAAAACRKANPDKPLWLSFILRRSETLPFVELMDGSQITDAVRLAVESNAEALLFNCSTPELIGMALKAVSCCDRSFDGGITKLPQGLRLGGYGNFFGEHKADFCIEHQETEPGKGNQNSGGLAVHDISIENYLASAREWVESGASIVGGCCGIGTEHVEAIAKELLKA
mmetsp:Transcript_15991/g.31235  ORF Transcript_15991/g.31235 Transcript_15991/m.31235 type:complete len:371 (-) Transcript_15991:61-1173(-)